MAQSLADISKRYGQYTTFGHKDYEAAKQQGYSDQDILNWLNQDLSRLHERNRPGGPDGLYDEISRGAVDLSKKVDIARGALPSAPATVNNNSEATPEPQGMTPFEYDYQRAIDLANIDKDINDMRNKSNEYIKQIEGETFTKVETIRAGASKYSDDLQREVDLYNIDRQKETALGVENIRAQGALDLRDIVNAGLKDVEKIRGQSARDVATIGGEFDVKSEEVKGKTARDVARIDRDKGIYGSLISAFQF